MLEQMYSDRKGRAVLFGMVREPSGPRLSSSEEVAAHFRLDSMADREWFQVLYMNQKNEVIEQGLESIGAVDRAMISVRDIIKNALYLGASQLIFVHNHPSGDVEPSLGDREITSSLVRAASLFEMKVLDHIIVGACRKGKHGHFSFADQGMIDDLEYGITSERVVFTLNTDRKMKGENCDQKA